MSDQPKYVGMLPWMADWWFAHRGLLPVIVLRCGRTDSTSAGGRGARCNRAIGEIKIDGDLLMAMSYNDHPETETDWTPLAAPTVEELAAEISERDAQALRYLGPGPGDGTVVYRRTNGPRELAPVEHMAYYVCPVHGETSVDSARLAEVVKDTVAAGRTKQTYWAVD